MRISFTFGADVRETQGKGASRRLRHTGKVPAILYGAREVPQALVLDQQNLLTMIADERFYSSIVRLKIGERTQEAIIKDVQMHPAKNAGALTVHAPGGGGPGAVARGAPGAGPGRGRGPRRRGCPGGGSRRGSRRGTGRSGRRPGHCGCRRRGQEGRGEERGRSCQ